MRRLSRDLVGGALMVTIGAFFSIHALLHLPLGGMATMGPGMYPFAAGALLAGIGLAIAARARPAAQGHGDTIRPRSVVFVLASLGAFGLLVRPFGLVPALIVLVLIATRADGRLSLRAAALLAVSVAVAALAIFRIGLGLQFAAFSWPWGG